ncbi:hypothetical protein ACQVP2_22230 [Methylobacterium aquaticum]|uniref:hypothetical protein n=1 Tax=Methylobacterium aquaticum TaxID=270351 RepID=UPI003D174327
MTTQKIHLFTIVGSDDRPMNAKPPPTIDDIAVILPPIVRALGLIVEQMEPLVDLACRATNLPEETADAMNDVGYALIQQSRALMHEAAQRRRSGPGRTVLRLRSDEAGAVIAETGPPPASPG